MTEELPQDKTPKDASSLVEAAPRITFIADPKKHPLAKTLKKLDKSLDEAIAYASGCITDF